MHRSPTALQAVNTLVTLIRRIDVCPLYGEQKAHKDEQTRNKEVHMLRTVLEAAAELTSLAAFGTMVALWALILA